MKKVVLTVAVLLCGVFVYESRQSQAIENKRSDLMSTLIPPVMKPRPLPPDVLKMSGDLMSTLIPPVMKPRPLPPDVLKVCGDQNMEIA